MAPEFRRAENLERSRTWEIDVQYFRNPARARSHDNHAVGQEHRLRDAVRDQYDCDALLPPDSQQFEVHRLARHSVERPERLIHQEDAGLMDERAANADTLSHASGEFRWVSVLEAGEPNRGEQSAGAAPCRAHIRTLDLRGHGNVGQDGPPRQQDGRLENDPNSRVGPLTPRPPIATSPEVRSSVPANMRRRVLLPQPLGPTTVTKEPGSIVTSTS